MSDAANPADFDAFAAARQQRRFAADVHRRQADDERRRAEAAFLYGSLRESERLRALAKTSTPPSPPPEFANFATWPDAGEDNAAYSDETMIASDGEDGEADTTAVAATHQAVLDFVSELRLIDGERDRDSSEEDEEAELERTSLAPQWLTEFFTSARFSAIYELTRLLQAAAAAGHKDGQMAAAEPIVANLLASWPSPSLGDAKQGEGAPKLQAELRRLLTEPHLAALLSAHDRLADVGDGSSSASPSPPVPPPQLAPEPPGGGGGAKVLICDPSLIRVTVTAPTPSPSVASLRSAASSVNATSAVAVAEVSVAQGDSRCSAETVVQDGVRFRQVTLVKEHGPLGATVKNVGDSVVISRIVCGGLLERTGLLSEGDELISVNDLELTGKHVNEVYDILQRLSGRLTFLSLPSSDYRPPERNNNNNNNNNNSSSRSANSANGGPLVLRALFTYEPSEDLYNPCKEAGLVFQLGDLIQVQNRRDPNWWQGLKLERNGLQGRGQSLAGIFPSPEFQRQRQMVTQSLGGSDGGDFGVDSDNGSGCCLRDLCRRYMPGGGGGGGGGGGRGGDDPATTYSPAGWERQGRRRRRSLEFYEGQARIHPQPLRRRPLVLVGLPGVGRHELRVRLVESDPNRFAPALLHTTRQRRPEEAPGLDFAFVSRAEFQRLAAAGEFLETGQFNGDLYGTSVSSVRQVVQSGKVCVLTQQAASLRDFRRHRSHLMPYAVFVSPPPGVDRFRALRRRLLDEATTGAGQEDGRGDRGRLEDSDAELRKLLELSRQMEEEFGHLVDDVLVNTDLGASLGQLLGIVSRLEREPQWVPAEWLEPSPSVAVAQADDHRMADTAC